jgi:hypothetical protein
MKLRTSFGQITTLIGCAGSLLLPCCLTAHAGEVSAQEIGYEIVGQVLNPSAQQSLQYGYLNFIKGLDRIATTPGVAVSETTALFTFYNDTATERVINNGPIRVMDRIGKGTIFFDSGNSDFANPDTFRKGIPVQSFTLRHQVVIDTATGYFSVTFDITITSAKPFEIDGKTYILGRRRGVYRLNVSGKLAAQTPPSAYIAGVANGINADLVENE